MDLFQDPLSPYNMHSNQPIRLLKGRLINHYPRIQNSNFFFFINFVLILQALPCIPMQHSLPIAHYIQGGYPPWLQLPKRFIIPCALQNDKSHTLYIGLLLIVCTN